MPIDPRRDSGETPAVASTDNDMMAMLRSIAADGHETRAALKDLSIGVAGLKGSHEDLRKSQADLGSKFLEVKAEIADVRAIATTANNTALEAKRGVSTTQHELTGTLAAVAANQSLVADKAEIVEKKTDSIASETKSQTASLTKLAEVNGVQSAQLQVTAAKVADVSTMVTKIRFYSPIFNAAAITVAVAIASAVTAYQSARPAIAPTTQSPPRLP